MPDIALWNKAREGAEQATKAHERLDAIAPLVHEHTEQIEKLLGEIKALKARMGKKDVQY